MVISPSYVRLPEATRYEKNTLQTEIIVLFVYFDYSPLAIGADKIMLIASTCRWMPEQSGAVPAPTEVCFDGVFSVLSIHFECTENTCFSFFFVYSLSPCFEYSDCHMWSHCLQPVNYAGILDSSLGDVARRIFMGGSRYPLVMSK